MDCTLIEWLGWGVSVIALLINYLQYRQNSNLKEKIKINSETKTETTQTHSGKGDNINVGRDASIKK